MRLASRIVPAAVVLSGLMLTTACANDADKELTASDSSTTPSASATLGSSPSASPSSSPSSSPAASSSSSSGSSGSSSGSSGSSSGSSGSSSGSKGVFSGTRQVLLLPKNSEATLGVVQGGKLGLSEKFGDSDLFVLTPISRGGDQYWIRTAKLRKGGEALCLSAKLGAGGKPAAVVTTACDADAADQKFRFRKQGDSNGKPTYTIYTGTNTFIIQDPTGEIAHTGTGAAAVQIGEGTPDIDTAYVLADKGKATMPALD